MGSTDSPNPYAPPEPDADGEPEPRDPPPIVSSRSTPKWSTVAAFATTERALEALRLLEGDEIECRVLQDGTSGGTVSFHWVRSIPLGGHLVQVQTRDLARAATVLGVSVDVDETPPENPADERMKKALVIALLGSILCPGLANLVSLGLILATPGAHLSRVGRLRRSWALGVDVAALAVVAFIIAT